MAAFTGDSVSLYNFTSSNVPGAYYGALPELDTLSITVPNGTVNLEFNVTQEDLDGSTWDSMQTVYYNHPNHESVYPSETGYQYQQVRRWSAVAFVTLPMG